MAPKRLILPARFWEAMRAHALDEFPEEACGLLAGAGERVRLQLRVANALRSSHRFRMEPRAQVEAMHQIEAQGLQLLAIYHSHPAGPSEPSPIDLAETNYPRAVACIVSRIDEEWRVRAYDLGVRPAREIELIIEPPDG